MFNKIKCFPRGAKPTPRHRLCAAVPHRIRGVTPTQAAWVPSKMSFWLNNQDGDCVTAEEAFNKACSGIFISDDTVQTWASANGVLNGADLDQVIQLMQSAGFSQDGNVYGDGSGSSVDYSTESVLQNAIAQAPVKIGIDADALPSGAGNGNGWVATGGSPGQFNNEDHCVSLCGFGPAGWLFQQLNVPLPSTLTATQAGYLLFTWNSIGFVDHAWIMSTCSEAWLRNPTTVVHGTNPPAPDPPLNPTPTPTPAPTPTPTSQIVLGVAFPAGTYTVSGMTLTIPAGGEPVGTYTLPTPPPAPPTPPPTKEIADVVAYLQTLSSTPGTLPPANELTDVANFLDAVATQGNK